MDGTIVFIMECIVPIIILNNNMESIEDMYSLLLLLIVGSYPPWLMVDIDLTATIIPEVDGWTSQQRDPVIAMGCEEPGPELARTEWKEFLDELSCGLLQQQVVDQVSSSRKFAFELTVIVSNYTWEKPRGRDHGLSQRKRGYPMNPKWGPPPSMVGYLRIKLAICGTAGSFLSS